MSGDLPVHSITAIATLVAALIAAAISFVNLTLNKEQKTSEFRQAWIDALREDLATFFACARAFSRATEEQNRFEPSANPIQISQERIGDIRYKVSEVYSRIILRLNSEEPEHEEMLRLLRRTIAEQNIALRDKSDASKTIAAIEIANDYARPLLKKEWIRVKEGELPFRIARNWVIPIIFGFSVLAIIFIWRGTFV